MPSSEVLHKWKAGELHSGGPGGPAVHSQKQAVAIMLSEKRKEDANGGVYPEKKAQGGPVVNKGAQSSVGHFAKGGAVQDRSKMKDFGKTHDGRYKKGDWKEDPDHDVEPQNLRTGVEDPGRLGDFLGGGDRFTSQNFAEQGEPASMQRVKPDEDWSKDHVPLTSRQKAAHEGDDKSESPRLPRKRGAAIEGR